jgi:hypothetical protein
MQKVHRECPDCLQHILDHFDALAMDMDTEAGKQAVLCYKQRLIEERACVLNQLDETNKQEEIESRMRGIKP